MSRLLVLAALLFALPAGAVDIDWVYVGDPGNAPDTATNCLPIPGGSPTCGSVPYAYRISKYEVTNAQYAEFLNAKAGSLSDPLGLYNTAMGSDGTGGGIWQGTSGKCPFCGHTYEVKAGFANKPVNYVSFYDALRFANWLHNGQGTGDTETGAYALNDSPIIRNEDARIFLPSENEWYKAAYYDPALPGYYDYPAGTDTPTTCAAPGPTPNTANCDLAVGTGSLTDVGSYTGSASPYGTFDQGGNVWEWNERIVMGGTRGIRGGGWVTDASLLAASGPDDDDPGAEFTDAGFRVAPEPAHALLVLTGGLVLAAARRAASSQPANASRHSGEQQ